MRSTRWRWIRAALVVATAIAVGTTQAHETLYLDDGRVYLAVAHILRFDSIACALVHGNWC